MLHRPIQLLRKFRTWGARVKHDTHLLTTGQYNAHIPSETLELLVESKDIRRFAAVWRAIVILKRKMFI